MTKKDAPENTSVTNQPEQGWTRLQEGHVPVRKGHTPVNMQTAAPPPPPPPKPAGVENVGRAPKPKG